MRRSRIGDAASLAGAVMALFGFGGAAHTDELVRLTDAQLDHLTAAASATASATGTAFGTLSSSTVANDLSGVGLPGQYNALVSGQVISMASSAGSNLPATASASLTLSLIVP